MATVIRRSGSEKYSQLGSACLNAITAYRKSNEFNNLKKETELKILSDIIKKHTGMNVKLYLDPTVSQNAAVQMPFLNGNHVFRYDWLRDWWLKELEETAVKDIAKDSSKSKLGWVDRKNQKVHGYFTEVEVPMWLGYDAIVNVKGGWDATPEEIAAVLLHEVGHAFSFFIAMDYTVRTNSALYAVHQELLDCTSQSAKVKLLSSASRDLNVEIDDVEGLARTNDKDMVSTVILSGIMKNIRNELGADIYDMRDCEAMADNFASKQGFGVDLVTGLDKFPVYKADKYCRSRQMLSLLLQIILNLTFTALTCGMWLFVVFSINNLTKIYDDPVERYTRIRQEMIGNLKNRDIPTSVKNRTLDDIEVIDGIISKYTNKPELLVFMAEFFLPKGRQNKSARQLNQLFEKLSNNDLYIAAAKFERLTS